MDIPDTITCVDCGQRARRMTIPPEDGWETGDIVAYRCTGCHDRWDLVIEEPDVSGRPDHPYAVEVEEVRARLRKGDS